MTALAVEYVIGARHRELLNLAVVSDFGVRIDTETEGRHADDLVELGLLREMPQHPQDTDQRRRLRFTVRGDELARHLARVELGLAS